MRQSLVTRAGFDLTFSLDYPISQFAHYSLVSISKSNVLHTSTPQHSSLVLEDPNIRLGSFPWDYVLHPSYTQRLEVPDSTWANVEVLQL